MSNLCPMLPNIFLDKHPTLYTLSFLYCLHEVNRVNWILFKGASLHCTIRTHGVDVDCCLLRQPPRRPRGNLSPSTPGDATDERQRGPDAAPRGPHRHTQCPAHALPGPDPFTGQGTRR